VTYEWFLIGFSGVAWLLGSTAFIRYRITCEGGWCWRSGYDNTDDCWVRAVVTSLCVHVGLGLLGFVGYALHSNGHLGWTSMLVGGAALAVAVFVWYVRRKEAQLKSTV
jgi:hypothetical protein